MRLLQMLMILSAVGVCLTGCTFKWDIADNDGDGYTITDCGPDDPAVNPGATEAWYNGVDENCDGNDGDQDGDGYVTDEYAAEFPNWEAFSAHLEVGDCHDDNADAFPGSGAEQVPHDCYSEDCVVNDGDVDGDGYLVEGYDADCPDLADVYIAEGLLTGDCWDDQAVAWDVDYAGEEADRPVAAEVNPAAAEEWYNGVDQNCDLADDYDQDGDGFIRSLECDDTDASIFPDDTIDEIWYNCADENCDGNDGDMDEDDYLALTFVDEDGVEHDYTEFCPDWEALNPDKPVGDCFDSAEVNATAINGFDDVLGANIYPGAVETWYDGVDQDCAGDSDFDADADGFNTDDARYPDADGVTGEDCEDTLSTVNPTVREQCSNGLDDDCDGGEDEISATGCLNYFYDGDEDGYGDENLSSSRCLCDPEGPNDEYVGYSTLVNTDCDDTSDRIYPGAAEITADNVDQDCDGGDTCYTDADRDGFGDSDSSTALTSSVDLDCSDSGESSVNDDCDDSDSGAYPNAPETVDDGVDQDCDGGDTCYEDSDGDGHGSTVVVESADLDCADSGESSLDDDCNDAVATIYDGAAEVVADGIDQDCDSVDDCYLDNDRDGFGSSTVVTGTNLNCNRPTANFADDSDDCDDTNNATGQATYPGAAPSDSASACMTDVDGDGFGDDSASGNVTAGTDCNDGDSAINPDAVETVANGVDQDCDNGELCYVDGDGDGYGDTSTAVRSGNLNCDAASSGFANDNSDCNDSVASINPGAAEVVVDGIDQDCDTFDDCYQDSDGDSYGSSTVVTATGTGATKLNCNRASAGLANDALDCDDTDAAVKPGATELAADGVDQNCDNNELCYVDSDRDGYGDTSTTTRTGSLDCNAASSGYANDDDDCDDSDAAINPGATELVADDVDQNCDDDELCYLDSDGDGYGSSTTSTLSNALDCAAASGYSDVNTDCRASDADTYPGAAYAESSTSCRTDADGDGYGDTNPSGSAVAGTDCDDSDAAINTAATELVADGVDQNCDDDELCYVDGDGDGYGDTSTSTRTGSTSCDASGSGFADDDDDCDDGDSDTYPGVAFNETNASNFCHNDDDGDGWGDQNISGSVDAGSDCDDSDSAVSPDGDELAACFDGIDNDCDDYYDNGCFDDGTNDGEELMFTELYYNDAGADTWFEVGNESGGDIDLYGFQFVLYDFVGASTVATFTVNTTTVFADGERLVFCKSATRDHTSGICDYAYGAQAGAFNMTANADLGVVVNAPYSVEVDAVDYLLLTGDGWPELPNTTTMHSIEYCDTTLSATGNDDGANWFEIPTANNDYRYYDGSGSNDFFGSPGDVNSCN